MKFIAPLTLVILAAPFAAMAGGPVTPTLEPPVAAPAPVAVAEPGVDWTGFYSNLSLGAGKVYGSGAGNDGNLRIAGVGLGYRRDMGKLVVGGELSYDKDDINQNSTATNATIKNTAGLKLIVGTDVGRTLVYGSVGIARAKADLSGVSGSDTGYSVGVGADYALNDQWTVGGELLTDRYDNFNSSGVDLRDTKLLLKVGLRF